jgi:hypothetical protein
MTIKPTREAVDLVLKLVDIGGLHIDGLQDPRAHLTIKQAAEEANRAYSSFYLMLMKTGSDLVSRPFGPNGDPRITRGNLWEFLSRSPRG